MAESISVRLDRVTLAYPHLFEKNAPPGTTNAKYSAEFILDPVANKAACAAMDDAFRRVAIAAGKGDALQYMQSPLKSGEALNAQALAKGRKSRPEIQGKMVVRASDATYQPQVVDKRIQPITAEKRDQIFGGCIVNAFVDVYYSKNQANPGVYVGLRGVQLVDNVNVEAFGGGALSAEQMFDVVDGAPEPLQRNATGGPGQPDDDDDINWG